MASRLLPTLFLGELSVPQLALERLLRPRVSATPIAQGPSQLSEVSLFLHNLRVARAFLRSF